MTRTDDIRREQPFNQKEELLDRARAILLQLGMVAANGSDPGDFRRKCIPLAADGSTRHFYRLRINPETQFIIAAPQARTANELAEAKAAWRIGGHLRQRNIPLPQLHGWDQETGLLIFEDLGDLRLHDMLTGPSQDEPALHARNIQAEVLYHQVIDGLLKMQLGGVEGFDPRWCWDTAKYDVSVMREKESDYFLRAFWKGMLGQSGNDGVIEEFDDIARTAAQANSSYFLHRDFQSRNIMVKDGAVRFIDYQGGRLGPLGYDLASLLIDPYARLGEEKQHELLTRYIEALGQLIAVDAALFYHEYRYLALQRNLQILGAYAFLSTVRGKPFFKTYLRPSLNMLANRLEDSLFAGYHQLKKMVRQAGYLLRD